MSGKSAAMNSLFPLSQLYWPARIVLWGAAGLTYTQNCYLMSSSKWGMDIIWASGFESVFVHELQVLVTVWVQCRSGAEGGKKNRNKNQLWGIWTLCTGLHAVLYWEDIVKMCISSLSPVDCSVDFISFLCASVRGDGMKHCRGLAGLAPTVAAECNVRLNLQQLIEVTWHHFWAVKKAEI